MILASAGTGKTQRLSARYLQLLHHDVLPREILAVTFTRKAAREILDRIVERLLMSAHDPAILKSLARDIHQPGLTPTRCLQLLARLTQQLHAMHVGTLDSYFSQVATNAANAWWAAGARLIDEAATDQLRMDTVQRILDDDVAHGASVRVEEIIHWLNKGESRRAVATLLSETIRDLYAIYLDSQDTGAAAWTMPALPGRLGAEDLHEALLRLQEAESKSNSLVQARDRAVDAIEQGQWIDFLTKGLVPCIREDQPYYRQTIPMEWIEVYRPLIAHAMACVVAEVSDYTSAAYQLLTRYHTMYTRLKRERRWIEYHDLPRMLIAHRHRDGRPSGWDDAEIKHLLLDEFQDTSLIQWQALQAMTQRVVGEPDTSSLYCVGDTKQSIYGWRGGVPGLLTSLPDALPGVKTETLLQSHRSSPPVIEIVNLVFRRIDAAAAGTKVQPAIREWCKQFRPHTTSRKELWGHVSLRASAGKDKDGIPSTTRTTCELVAQLVSRHPQATIAVLVLRNAVVADVIHLLNRMGIAASDEGGEPLTRSAAVRLLLSTIKLAAHPSDSIARFHLLHSPLARPWGWKQERQEIDRVDHELSARLRWALFHDGIGPTLHGWAQYLRPVCPNVEWQRVEQLIEQGHLHDQLGWTSLSEFMQRVELEKVRTPTTSAVRVMTVHQAKGLQFDAVVVSDLESRLIQPPTFAYQRAEATWEIERVARYVQEGLHDFLPKSVRACYDATFQRDVQERLSVLYVALTRAIHALHVVVAPAENPKQRTPSLADLVRMTLTSDGTAPADEIVFESGSDDWLSAVPMVNQVSPETMPVPSQASKRPVWSTRPSLPLEFTAPTSMKRRRTHLQELFDSSADRDEALHIGTIAHRVLQQIEWWCDDENSAMQVRKWLVAIHGEHRQESDLLGQLMSWLQSDAMRNVLQQDRYLKTLPSDLQDQIRNGRLNLQVRREIPLTARLTESRLNPAVPETPATIGDAILPRDHLFIGVIDRMVLVTDDRGPLWAHVFDFKTDAVEWSNLEVRNGRIASYTPQVQAYCQMASSSLKLGSERVRGELVFVRTGVAVRVWPASGRSQGASLGE